MAEAAGLALATITAFKEVFLLSRAIYRAIRSARHASNEKLDLHVEFYHELLFLRDFGHRFLQDSPCGILGSDWLELVEYDLQQLRRAFSDYQSLAAKGDKSYQQWSPLLNEDVANTAVIEFGLEVETPNGSSALLDDVNARLSGWWSSTTSGVKWVLLTRRKYEKVLADFRRWNGKLKEIGHACMLDQINRTATGPSNSTVTQLLLDVEHGCREEILGLAAPAKLKRLLIEPKADTTDFEIKSSVLHATDLPLEQSFVVANLTAENGTTEKILAEYKGHHTIQQAPNTTAVHQLANLLATSENTDLKTLPFSRNSSNRTKGIQITKLTLLYLISQSGPTRKIQPLSLLH